MCCVQACVVFRHALGSGMCCVQAVFCSGMCCVQACVLFRHVLCSGSVVFRHVLWLGMCCVQACVLFRHVLCSSNVVESEKKLVFYISLIFCFPAYFLSFLPLLRIINH